MTHPPPREPIRAQDTEHTLNHIARNARAITTLLESLLTRAIPDGVAGPRPSSRCKSLGISTPA